MVKKSDHLNVPSLPEYRCLGMESGSTEKRKYEGKNYNEQLTTTKSACLHTDRTVLFMPLTLNSLVNPHAEFSLQFLFK